MDIDQRLEALAQSLELLASFQKDSEKRMDKLTDRMDKLAERMDKLAEQMVESGKRLDRLTDIVAPIALLVLEHQSRIKRLEDRPS